MPAPCSRPQHARGERGIAGCVVAQRAQLRVEAAEVVDRLVARRGQHHRHARRGVRRDGDDRPRPAEGGVDRRAEAAHEGAGGAGLEGDHRRAVRDEDRGQGGVHAPLEHRPRRRSIQPALHAAFTTRVSSAPAMTPTVRRTAAARRGPRHRTRCGRLPSGSSAGASCCATFAPASCACWSSP